MDTASPTKRRVLGALDPNAAASPRTPQPLLGVVAKQQQTNVKNLEPFVASSPTKRSPSRSQQQQQQQTSLPSPRASRPDSAGDMRKRSVQEVAPPRGEVEVEVEDENASSEPAKKRPCLREDVAEQDDVSGSQQSPVSPLRQRSASPETSSVFDNSINDTSHATAITEPEEQLPGAPVNSFYTATAAAAVAASGPVRRGTGSRLTREQARQKAETIRLRLGLAAYKVRTGQTDVPLEHLQVRPVVLPRNNNNNGATTSALFAAAQQQQQQSSSQQGTDYRRALPSGISLSAFGSGGARRSSQETVPQQRQQQQRTTPPTPAPAPAPTCTCQASQQRQQEETGGSDKSAKEDGNDNSSSSILLKSSPPVLPASLAHVREERGEEDGLPRLEAVSTSATMNNESQSSHDSQTSAATTTTNEEDVLPDAASGLLSLARG